jgi:hypothetical protein
VGQLDEPYFSTYVNVATFKIVPDPNGLYTKGVNTFPMPNLVTKYKIQTGMK